MIGSVVSGDWAEWIGSIATAVSVIVAIVVFYFTARDSQKQSALNWKPHLAFDHDLIEDSGSWDIGATNIGKGPALECRYVACIRDKYFRARAFAIASDNALKGKRHAIALHERDDKAAIAFCERVLRDLKASDSTRSTWEVLICSDIFGKRWRFVRGRPYPDGPEPAQESGNGWWAGWRSQKAEGDWVHRARDVDRTPQAPKP